MPLKEIEPEEPKLLPLMVTGVPSPPEVTDKVLITGEAVTVKGPGAVATPSTLTTTFTVVGGGGVIPAGIVATMNFDPSCRIWVA